MLPHTWAVMGSGSTPDPVTLVYKTVPTSSPGPEGGSPEVPLRLDVYLPDSRPNNILAPGNDSAGLPAVVYFHGGGLLVGNRKSWFPEWLHGKYCLNVMYLPGFRANRGYRTSIWPRCSFSLGRLPTPFPLNGARYSRRHPRSFRLHQERSEPCSRRSDRRS